MLIGCSCQLAISRFQRLAIHPYLTQGVALGFFHFAPLALGIRVLTQPLQCWVQVEICKLVRETDD
jgi:hypothetical protein